MQDYRTLTLENIYAPDEITDALSLLQSCGIESIVNPSNKKCLNLLHKIR